MFRGQHILWILLTTLPITLILCVGIGAASIPVPDILLTLAGKFGLADASAINQQTEAIIWFIRFPRVLMGLIVGGGLALCGVAMQGLFRNP